MREPGLTDKIEKTTHVDFNRGGIVYVHRPPSGGGLFGKIERATHIDLNRDDHICGRPGCYPPVHSDEKH